MIYELVWDSAYENVNRFKRKNTCFLMHVHFTDKIWWVERILC